MKLYQFALLFLGVFILCVTEAESKRSEVMENRYERHKQEQVLSTAVDAATAVLFEGNEDSLAAAKKEEALNVLGEVLAAGFGCEVTREEKNRLLSKLPVVLIFAADGYCVGCWEESENRAGEKAMRGWQEKVPYRYENEAFVCDFSLGTETVRLTDKTGCFYGTTAEYAEVTMRELEEEEQYEEARRRLPDSFLWSLEECRAAQRAVIGEVLNKTLAEAFQKQTADANEKEGTYRVRILALEDGIWEQAVSSPGILVIYRAEPFLLTKEGETFYFAAAAERAGEVYPVTEEKEKLVYHTQNCVCLTKQTVIAQYESMERCAMAGAVPCKDCIIGKEIETVERR